MTQTPDRPGIDQLTSDMLDQLYAERDRYRFAWHSARERAQALGEGAIRHVADRDAWMGWTKKAKEAVQYWYDAAVERLTRAERAEATLNAIRALHQPTADWSWRAFGCEHNGAHTHLCAHCRTTCYPCPTVAALDQHGQTPKETT